jgi:hypothetical protein
MKCPSCGKDTPEDVNFCIWCQTSLRQSGPIRNRTPGNNRRKVSWKGIIVKVSIILIVILVISIILSNPQMSSHILGQYIFPGHTMLEGTYPDKGGYTLRGSTSTIDLSKFNNYSVYSKLNSNQPLNYANEPDAAYYKKILDNPDQKPYINDLLSQIKLKTSNKDDQARICINFVQHIPYDFETSSRVRYPYQVIYDYKGDCDEKSLLLAYLLRELGYGVALFNYKPEKHMAVGILAPSEYDSHNSGYAFIETTRPTIVTDDQGEYLNNGLLTSTPVIIPISQGITFASIKEENADAIEFNTLRKMAQPLDSYHFARWQVLEDKYAMNFEKY